MKRYRLIALGAAMLALCLMFPGAAPLAGADSSRQTECRRGAPLTESEVEQLAEAGVEEATIRRNVDACGVSFILGDEAARRWRKLGVSEQLIGMFTPPARRVANVSWTAPVDQRAMVWVAAGSFVMGSQPSEPGRDDDELPHLVRIERGFWIDVDEVTNAAFRRFVVARPEWAKGKVDAGTHDGNYLKDWTGVDFPTGQGTEPVRWVSWRAAQAFAAWAGKRLPTEAEWEYAARSGTTTAYWWGNEFAPERVVMDAARQARTSPWGMASMLGGMWEWTSSVYANYPYRAEDGREDAVSTVPRVVRGGFYNAGARFVRAANRSSERSQSTSDVRSFRCAY